MPEDGEIRASGKLLHQAVGWEIIRVEKYRYSKWCIDAIKTIQRRLPLTITDIHTQGKELAIIFYNQCALLFNMGTGAAFYIGKSSEKATIPLSYRTNLALICSNNMTIYVVDCHCTQNQVRLCWRKETEQIWTFGRGPDLVDVDEQQLIHHLNKYVSDEDYSTYFTRATLIECLLNQSLFNGIGAYLSSEICYWVYERTGIRPWKNFKALCDEGTNFLVLLVRIIRTYLRFMEKYIAIHGSQHSCLEFNEWKWQNFRAVFIRAYRQPSTLVNGARVQLRKFSFGLTKAGSKGMKITCTKAQCFTPALSVGEEVPQNWTEKKVNPIGPNSLAVGWFSWYGGVDRYMVLESDQKNAIQLRPSSLEHLQTAMKSKQAISDEPLDVSSEEFDDEIDSENEIEIGNDQDPDSAPEFVAPPIEAENKRQSQRKRIVTRLNKEIQSIKY